MLQSLEELLQECTVKITIPGQSGWGTGFFVAPGLILTCAHVVRKAADLQVTVFYPPRKQPLSAIVKAKVDDGKTLDLALVELSEPLSGHPCVLLDEEPVAIGQALYGYGYLESYTNAAPVRPVNEGLTGDTPPLLKLQSAQIEKGISGAALLNLRTGKVCGMVKETRATGFDLGGGAIPTSVILEQFPELRELQQAFHKGDLRWSELLPTTHSSETLNDQKVRGYLRSLSSHYEKWWNIYRLTEAISARQSTFTFEQIAQTEEQSKEDPTKKETVPLPQFLQGIIDYAESEPVLLVGSPGVGKSTTLLRLLVDLAKQELQKPTPRIPVLIRLKDYQLSLSSPEDISGMLALIKESLEPELILEISGIKTLLFQEKRLFLLLDGLNEIPADVARNKLTHFRDQCKRSKVPLICTTRYLGDDFGIQRKVELRPLSPKEIQRFLSECMPGQEQQVLKLVNKGNQELSKTPFVLWMLYDACINSDQIPENLGEAFRRFTKNYTNYKINQEGIPHSQKTLQYWGILLEYLAFQMLRSPDPQDPGLIIPERQSANVLTQFPGENTIDLFQAQALLNNLLKYYLLQKSHKDEVSFCHQLIQEYYAAEYLLKLLQTLTNDQLKQDYLNLLKWTEPIALMLALVDDKKKTLWVVKLAINDVDLILGARLVGVASIDVQKYILDYICKPRFPRKLNFSLFNKKRCLDIPDWLKIKILEKTQSTYAFTYLRILLRNAHSVTRIKAIHALVQLDIDSQEVVEELSVLQQDPDNLVREAASYTLKSFQFKWSLTQKNISDLNKLLSDRWKNDQNNLISSKNERNEFQESQWPETLKGYLKSSNPDLRRDAVYTISQQGLTDLLPELFSMMDDPSPEVRRNIAKAFGTFRVKEAVDQLTRFLGDDDLYVVANSCEALGKLGDSAVVPKLLKVLADNFNLLSNESLTVTAEVCKSLGRLGGNLAITELSRVLMEHQVFWVRKIAAKALGKISDTNSVKYLAYVLKTDKSECVKWEAAKSLAHLGSLESVQFLSNGLDDSRQDRRRESIKSLGKLKPPDINLLAVKALQDSDIIVSDIATRILVEIESQELIPKVIDLLNHQDSDIRWKAGRVLKHCETTSLLKFLPELTKTVYSELGEQAHDLVQHIQSSPGCQFYNYTIVKQRKVGGKAERFNDRLIEHRQNSSIRLLTQIDKTTQTISQKVEKMADEPRIENNISISDSPNSPINAPIGTSGVTQSKVIVSNSAPREGVNWGILLAVLGIFVALAAIPISMTVSGAFNEEFRQWFKQISPAQIEQESEYSED